MSCILSIDVGVKNLAVCVLQHQTGDIVFWKCYDLLSDTQLDRSQPKKSTGAVGKCENLLKTARGKESKKVCGRNGPVNSRGRAYCGVHDPTKRQGISKQTQAWCWAMLQNLPMISTEINESGANVDEIVIEQQSVKSRKMLLMGHLIYGHFVQTYENQVTVRFVPAWNKLSVYKGPEIACTLKTKYARNKYLARKHTEQILGTESQKKAWLENVFQPSKKQDDLADSFLQGCYYLRKGK